MTKRRDGWRGRVVRALGGYGLACVLALPWAGASAEPAAEPPDAVAFNVALRLAFFGDARQEGTRAYGYVSPDDEAALRALWASDRGALVCVLNQWADELRADLASYGLAWRETRQVAMLGHVMFIDPLAAAALRRAYASLTPVAMGAARVRCASVGSADEEAINAVLFGKTRIGALREARLGARGALAQMAGTLQALVDQVGPQTYMPVGRCDDGKLPSDAGLCFRTEAARLQLDRQFADGSELRQAMASFDRYQHAHGLAAQRMYSIARVLRDIR